MNKKKITILTKSHWKQSQGGAELQCMYLLEEAKKNNIKSSYCFLSNGKYFDTDNFVNYFPIKKKRIFTKLRNIVFPYFFYIYKELKKSQPDVIYNRAGSALTGICVFFGKKTGIRTVFHIAGDSDLDKNLQHDKDLTKIERILTNYGIKNADIIISQTHHQSSLLKKHYNRTTSAVIPNGHNVPNFIEKSYNKIKIVWIANWKKNKRPEIFITMVKNGVWPENIEFIMVGRLGNYEKLAKEAKELSIIVKGEISNNAVNELLQESHLLINTSVHEGFSNTFIQAWMRSVPVISLSVDPDDLLNNNGLGVCAGTQEKLLIETLKFINNLTLLKKVGQKTRKFSVEHFSLNNFTKLLLLITN